MSEAEKIISLKFSNPCSLKDPCALETLEFCYKRLLPFIPKMSGLDLIFHIPRSDKDTFFAAQQILKKLSAKLPAVNYFDSRQKIYPPAQSFFSSDKDYNSLFGNPGIEEDNNLSDLVVSIQENSVDNQQALEDFKIKEIFKEKKEEKEKELFSMEIKDILRFQAFLAMINDEKDEKGVVLPGIDKSFPLRIDCKKKPDKNLNEIVIYGLDGYNKNYDYKKLLEDYISRLSYERIDAWKLQKFAVKSFDFIIERLQKEEKSVRFIKDFKGNLLIVAFLKRMDFIEIFKKISELKIFRKIVMNSIANIKDCSKLEEIIAYYKLNYFADIREMEYRFRSIAQRNNVNGFQIDKSKKIAHQDLIFSYESNQKNDRIFTIEYEKIMRNVREICVSDIPANIFKMVKGLVERIRNEAEESCVYKLCRMYYTPNDKKVAGFVHIIFLGDEEAETEMQVNLLIFFDFF